MYKNLAIITFFAANLLWAMDPPKERFELHFFWTKGQQLSLSELEAKKVTIGGDASNEASFFDALEQELQRNDDFDVVMVCDDPTEISNKDKFAVLKQKYKSRFSVRKIDVVVRNLLNVFAGREFILGKIFQNATGGNPVIASDFYRIIGLLFGGDYPFTTERRLFAYCDVDLFAHRTAQVMDSLRKPFNNVKEKGHGQNWYGIHADNNDLIKHFIIDRREHFSFCAQALLFADLNYSWEGSILDLYPNLDNAALKAQDNPEKGFYDYKEKVHPYIGDKILIKTLDSTGRAFWDILLESKNIQNLDYKHHCPGSWLPGGTIKSRDFISGHILHRDSLIPFSGFLWVWNFLFSLEPGQLKAANYGKITTKFLKKICQYDNFFKIYLLAKKRYGDDHPLVLRFQEELAKKFPFTSDAYRIFLCCYAVKKKAAINLEFWQKEAFKQLNKSYEQREYCVFTYMLEQLQSAGVDISFRHDLRIPRMDVLVHKTLSYLEDDVPEYVPRR